MEHRKLIDRLISKRHSGCPKPCWVVACKGAFPNLILHFSFRGITGWVRLNLVSSNLVSSDQIRSDDIRSNQVRSKQVMLGQTGPGEVRVETNSKTSLCKAFSKKLFFQHAAFFKYKLYTTLV
jgi:hypothetical protein